MASISIYQGTSDCVLRARDRLRAGEPPSSKAKQEFKDCEIFEEFLELAQNLRAGGFGERMIFVSSNTSDYGRPPGAPRIQEDLLEHGAEYVSSLSWALSSIRNP
jgi:hypothetical protein